jgi:hypothetical protein
MRTHDLHSTRRPLSPWGLLPLLGALGLAGCVSSPAECPPGASCTVDCASDSDCGTGQVCALPGQPLAGTCTLPERSCADREETDCKATPGCQAIYLTPDCVGDCAATFDYCVTVSVTACDALDDQADCQVRSDCQWQGESCQALSARCNSPGCDPAPPAPTCAENELLVDGRCQPSCASGDQCKDGSTCSLDRDSTCLNPCPDNPAGGVCQCLGVCQQPAANCQGLDENECGERSGCEGVYCSPCPPGAECFCDGFVGCTSTAEAAAGAAR